MYFFFFNSLRQKVFCFSIWSERAPLYLLGRWKAGRIFIRERGGESFFVRSHCLERGSMLPCFFFIIAEAYWPRSCAWAFIIQKPLLWFCNLLDTRGFAMYNGNWDIFYLANWFDEIYESSLKISSPDK